MAVMPVRVGQLRHRLAIQTATESVDAMGGVSESWATDITVWGQITRKGGGEKTTGEAVKATATHEIVIRYYSGLTPKNRFLFGSREFNILSVRDFDERNCYMICDCVEVV